MPKSTKKKKDKAADFTKAKLKLGKGKQAASNAVDTSFKARSIALPTQNIAVEKDEDVPSTKRKLTFDALLVHMKHYNASTRRDAILGLRELLETHSQLIPTHLTALINGCDAHVRKTLLSFFSWLFRQVSRDDLAPHSPVLLLFTTSAQTHIFPEIRIDAVRLLDIYLEYIPEVVTEGWMHPGGGSHGRRVMEGYLGILNAGTTFGEVGDTGPVQATSTASVVLSPASKLVVLRSFESFLAHAVSSSWNAKDTRESSAGSLTTPTWYLSSFFASTSAFDTFDALLQPRVSLNGDSLRLKDRRIWSPEISGDSAETFVGQFPFVADLCSSAWSLQDIADIDDAVATLREEGRVGSGTDAEIVCAEHLARTLHPTLVSTFLDCAPTVFSPSSSPPETELQMVAVVCRICRSLYGRLLQDTAESGTTHDSAKTNLQTILSYLSPYFPFAITVPNARRDIKVEQAFQDLNLIFCELSSFLLLASQRTITHQSSSRKTPRPVRSNHPESTNTPASTVQSRQIERVSAYIVQLLQGQNPAPSQSLRRPITPQAYIALLPTMWSLVNGQRSDVSDHPSSSIFSIVVDHAIKASSTSAVKRHTVDFIGRLLLLDKEPQYMGSFEVGRFTEQDVKLEEWILQLPRALWELGSNHLATTETIVRLLLRLAQRRSRLLQASTFAALRSRLLPYFTITHPTRGKLPGPYAKLPAQSPLRRLVLDLVVTVIAQGYRSTNVDDALEATVSEAVQATPEASYWAGVLAHN
ncbi:hypothetical protein V8D89_015524, partial [Ganoderma adspersum]